MKVKLIAIILFIAIGAAVALFCVSSDISTESEYKGYVEAARTNAERDIPYVAVTNYQKAFDMEEPDEELYLEYLEQMKKLGEDYYETAIKDYLTRFPMSASAYEMNVANYFNDESYSKVVELAAEAHEKGVATEAVENYYTQSIYKFKYLKTGFEYASSFLGGNALVKKGGLYGYLSSYGDYTIAPFYKDANFMFAGTAAVNDGEEWCMVNTLGFRVARTDTPVDELSFSSNGLVLAKKDKKYAYLTTSLKVPEEFPYDDATNFKNGVAAVKKDNKWALVSNEGKEITDYIFDDIIRDEYNTCISYGVIFAKQDGGVYMYDANGKKICDTKFDDACAFVSTQPAAVKVGDSWGFVDTTGKMVIEPQFEDAKSFCVGLAPVCQEEHWNYINTNGEVRIEENFDDAKSFSAEGIAAVLEGESWNYIQLLTYAD